MTITIKDNMSYIKKDKLGVAASERAEKMISALYLVTGLLSEKEPLKSTLRTDGLTLLSLCIENASDSKRDKGEVTQAILLSLEGIESKLSVAKVSRTISIMNAELLLRGFATLRHFFETEEQTLFESLDATHDLIASLEDRVEEKKERSVDIRTNESSGDSNSGSESREHGNELLLSEKRRSLSDEHKSLMSKDDVVAKVWINQREKEFPRGVFKARKVGRREQILSVFVKDRDISIKEISAKVKGCSEKTIQRELNTLVFDHILQRIGEKRWSRYVLR